MWDTCARLKIIRKKNIYLPLGEEEFLGNSRNSPTLQHSPFGKGINGQICDPSAGLLSVCCCPFPLPASKEKTRGLSVLTCNLGPTCTQIFVNVIAVSLWVLFLFTSFNACCVLAGACICYRLPLHTELSCRQYNRSVIQILIPLECKAAFERRDTKNILVINLFCKGFAAACKKISGSLMFLIDFWAEIWRAKICFKRP